MDLNSKGLSRILLSAFTALTLTNCGGESGADSAEDDVASSDTTSNHVLFTERANNHQVFMAEDGNGVAVWSAENSTGNDSIWSSIYQSSSNSWSIAAQITSYDGDIYDFEAATSDRGAVQIVWQQSNPSISFVIKDQVWGNSYQPGTGWVGPTLFSDLDYSSTDTYIAGTPKVSMNDNEVVLVVWKQVDSSGVGTSVKSLYSTRVDSLSASPSTELIDDDIQEDLENLYEVSLNDNGNALVAWSDEATSPATQKYILSSFYSNGAGWSAANTVEADTTDDINNFNTIELQRFQNDDAVVLWSYLTASTAVNESKGRQYMSTSDSWEAAYSITPDISRTNRAFDVTFNTEGEGVFLFTELTSGIFPLEAQLFSFESGFATSQTVPEADSVSLLTAHVDIDDSAYVVALSGHDGSSGTGDILKGHRYDPSNGWDSSISFGDFVSGSSDFYVDIVPDSNGDTAMALHIRNELTGEYELIATKLEF